MSVSVIDSRKTEYIAAYLAEAEIHLDIRFLQILVSISDAVHAASDRDQLFSAVSDSVRALGFDGFHLSSHKKNKVALVSEPIFATFPARFLDDYDRQSWADVDPVTELVFARHERFVWNIPDARAPETRTESFIEFMRSLEMSTWLVMPTHQPEGTVSGLAMISRKPQLVRRGRQLAAALISSAALARAEMLGLSSGISADEATALRLLSPAQTEILKWVAEGKSNAVIATITESSERTVRYHVSEILRKFGIATRQQAAAIYRESTTA